MRSATSLYIATITIILLSVFRGDAQVLSWQHQMTNETGETKRHLETSDGKVMMLSSTTDSITGLVYSTLVKCDTNGTVLWIYRFGQEYYEFSRIAETPGNNFIFAFTGMEQNNAAKEIHLVKISTAGSEIFTHIIQLPSPYVVQYAVPEILPDNSGGYFLSAIITDSLTSGSYLNITSLDSSGNINWSNLYDTLRGQSGIPCIDTCANGDLLVACSAMEVPSNNITYALHRINQNGNLQWSKHFQSNNFDLHVRSMNRIGVDSFYITGMCRIPFTTYPETCVMLINGNGGMSWFNRYGFPGLELNTHDATVDQNKNLAFVSFGTDSASQIGSIAGVINPAGQLEVAKFFHWYEFTSIEYAGYNSFSVAGGGTLPYWHPTYMLLDSQLTACYDANVGLATNSIPVSVTSGSGMLPLNVVVTNDSLAHPPLGITLLYGCGPNSIAETTEADVLIYPVPANDYLHIVSNTKIEHVEIFDASGRLVLSRAMNTSAFNVDVTTLSPGLYLLRVTDEEQQLTAKQIQIQRN